MKNKIIFIASFSSLLLFSCGFEGVFNNPAVAGYEICECLEKARGQGFIANYACLEKNKEYVEMYSAMATPNDSSAINTYSAIAGLCILREVKSRLDGDDEE